MNRQQLVCIGAALVILCSLCCQPCVIPDVNFNNAQQILQLPLECHQEHELVYDTVLGRQVVSVTAYPARRYPGINAFWLRGDLSRYSAIMIEARTVTVDTASFWVVLADGEEHTRYDDIVHKKFLLSQTWQTCTVPLNRNVTSENGRVINRHHVDRVLFHTGHHADSLFTFRIARVWLSR